MAEILLFHHALGLTDGVKAFADDLRAAGHTVHTPDAYEGRTFETVDDGVAHARSLGMEAVMERGVAVADDLPTDLVYAGMSLGVMAAQKLAQTRPGAKGALFLHGAAPLDEFGGTWPDGLPLQIHTMTGDDWGDVDVAQELAAQVATTELFLYPGDAHLFTDRSLRDQYDAGAAAQVLDRVQAFLDAV